MLVISLDFTRNLKQCRYIVIFAGTALSGGTVGLILTYTLNISGVFQQCVRQSTEVENQVTGGLVNKVFVFGDLARIISSQVYEK